MLSSASILKMRHILISIIITICFCLDLSLAEVCRKQKGPLSEPEHFQCPRIFESKKKSWCCGATPGELYCCEWSERAKEVGHPRFDESAMLTYGAIGFFGLIFMFVMLWSLYFWLKRHNLFTHRRHSNCADSPSGYPHHPGAPPLTAYPPLPPYTMYPGGTGAYLPQQDHTDDPPPYNTVCGLPEGQSGAGIHPISVPLLSSEQKDSADLKAEDESIQKSVPHQLTTGFKMNPTVPVDPNQPPFNPSYT